MKNRRKKLNLHLVFEIPICNCKNQHFFLFRFFILEMCQYSRIETDVAQYTDNGTRKYFVHLANGPFCLHVLPLTVNSLIVLQKKKKEKKKPFNYVTTYSTFWVMHRPMSFLVLNIPKQLETIYQMNGHYSIEMNSCIQCNRCKYANGFPIVRMELNSTEHIQLCACVGSIFSFFSFSLTISLI